MEVPYHRIKGRGDIYLIVGEATWRGAFQAKFTENDHWRIIFSNKDGLREFSEKEDYFLLETKKQSIQRKMERHALHMILCVLPLK